MSEVKIDKSSWKWYRKLFPKLCAKISNFFFMLPLEIQLKASKCGLPTTPEVCFYMGTWEKQVGEPLYGLSPIPRAEEWVEVHDKQMDEIISGQVKYVSYEYFTHVGLHIVHILLEPEEE